MSAWVEIGKLGDNRVTINWLIIDKNRARLSPGDGLGNKYTCPTNTSVTLSGSFSSATRWALSQSWLWTYLTINKCEIKKKFSPHELRVFRWTQIVQFTGSYQAHIKTASLDFPALINSFSASLNFPSSSRNMAYFRWISGSLDFMAVRDKSNANSKALK